MKHLLWGQILVNFYLKYSLLSQYFIMQNVKEFCLDGHLQLTANTYISVIKSLFTLKKD